MQGQNNVNQFQNQQYFMNQSFSQTHQQVYYQYGSGGGNNGFMQQNTLPPALTPQPSNIMLGGMNPMAMNQMGGGNGGGNYNNNSMNNMNNMNNNMMMMNNPNSGVNNGNNNQMIGSGGGVSSNNNIHSGGGGNMGGGNGGSISNSLINSGGKQPSDQKNRWFPTNDNDPFHTIEQEKIRPQYKSANWADASKYQEIVNSLNSPTLVPQNAYHQGNINTMPNMHPQHNMMGNHMISTMPNLPTTPSQLDMLSMNAQQQQQYMMMNQQQQQQQPQQQVVMMTPQQQQHFMAMNPQQQQQFLMMMQQNAAMGGVGVGVGVGGAGAGAGGVMQQTSSSSSSSSSSQQQITTSILSPPPQPTTQRQVTSSGGSQNNNANAQVAAAAMMNPQGQFVPAAGGGMAQIIGMPGSNIPFQMPATSGQGISPQSSISPQKQQSLVSPTSSLGSGQNPVSLTGSLPSTTVPSKSNPTSSGGVHVPLTALSAGGTPGGSANVINSAGSVNNNINSGSGSGGGLVIPPIPSHLHGSAFANPTKHASGAALSSIIQPTQPSQQQFSSTSGSFTSTNTSTTHNNNIQPLQQQQQQQQSNQFTFEQFIIPQAAEPKPIFKNEEDRKKSIEKYSALETLVAASAASSLLSPREAPSSVFAPPTNATGGMTEEEYKKMEEKIRKEVEEKLRREFEERIEKERQAQQAARKQQNLLNPPAPAVKKTSHIPPSAPHVNTSTTTSSAANSTTTTTSVTSPNHNSAFPMDLFADLTTTTTTTSSQQHHTTTTSSASNVSPNLSRNPYKNPAEKDRLKKELSNIHQNAKPPGVKAPANKTATELSCPICHERFANERVLSVHIDDSHPATKQHDIVDKIAAASLKDQNTTIPTTIKQRAKTISTPTPVSKDKKSVSFELDELKQKSQSFITTSTHTSSTSSSSHHTTTTTTINKPRSDSTEVSFESVYIPPKPVRILSKDEAATILQKYVRRWKCRKEYKREILRTKAVKELVYTEHTYVDGLEKLVEQFAFPLKGLCLAEKPLISEEDIETIFGKHEIILSLNRELCKKMVQRIAKWTSVQKIGDVLIDTVTQEDFKTIYNSFTLSFQDILSTIERLSNSKSQFKAYLKNAEKSLWTNGSATGTNLQALLITPVQRITRYLLLLKEIIRYTKPSHPDYDSLCISLFEIQDICTDVNENQRKEEKEKIRIQTLTNIYQRIEPKPKELNLVSSDRFLIREGKISQYDPEDEKRKDRIYYLFNDLILIAKESKKKLLLKNVMYLNTLKFRNIADGQKTYGITSKYAFELRGHGDQVLMFFAENQEEKESLLKDLEVVISSFCVIQK